MRRFAAPLPGYRAMIVRQRWIDQSQSDALAPNRPLQHGRDRNLVSCCALPRQSNERIDALVIVISLHPDDAAVLDLEHETPGPIEDLSGRPVPVLEGYLRTDDVTFDAIDARFVLQVVEVLEDREENVANRGLAAEFTPVYGSSLVAE